MNDPNSEPTNQDVNKANEAPQKDPLKTSSPAYRRRERRALPRTPKSNPLVALMNSLILVIGLSLILLSRCEGQSEEKTTEVHWLNGLITPKDLHLPKSVTDLTLSEKEQEESSKIEPTINKRDFKAQTNQNSIEQ